MSNDEPGGVEMSEDELEMSSGYGGKTQKYLIVIEKAETNFSAYSPDLPGCVATGKTLEEAEEQMYEAIVFHLEGLEEDGVTGFSEDLQHQIDEMLKFDK